MNSPIHPESLKFCRRRKKWSQEELAEATHGRDKVSLSTVKRIESTKEPPYLARNRVAKALSRALGVSVDQLAEEPSPEQGREEALREFAGGSLSATIDAETVVAYDMVQHIYGISIRSQIAMAPLFAALLAEGSLNWRRKRLAAIEQAAEKLMNLDFGQFYFASAALRAGDGTAAEEHSINSNDIFGKFVFEEAIREWYDPSENSPFAEFLDAYSRSVKAKNISLDPNDLDSMASEKLPSYEIGADVIAEFSGGDPEAGYALSRGYVRIKDIPKELLGPDNKENRAAWIIEKIPEKDLSSLREILSDEAFK